LVTILALVAQKTIRPFFMPEMLMGFTSQSFVPDLNRLPFRADHAPVPFIFFKNCRGD
jgi:hypothetical protein